jgi:hypothetical protein
MIGVILYFNLPYGAIIKDKIEPKKMLSVPINSDEQSSNIQTLLEAFEDK